MRDFLLEDNMLQIEHLTLIHKKDLRPLIKDFNFTLNKTDKVAIIGEEGNGKSTLLMAIANKTAIEDYMEIQGHIFSKGLRIEYLPQELPPLYSQLTVYDYFMKNEEFFSYTSGELAHLAAILTLPLPLFYSQQQLKTLSGGEKVKIQLANILLKQPDVLLLDEPSNDLDIDTLIWLEDFIIQYPFPIIFISHDKTLVKKSANVIIHLEQLRKKSLPRHTISRTSYEVYMELRNISIYRQEKNATNERIEFHKKEEKFRRIQQKVQYQQNTISRQDPHGGALLKQKMHTVKAMGRRYEKEKNNLTDFPEYEEPLFSRFDSSISIPTKKEILSIHLPQLSIDNRLLSQNINLEVRGPEKICIIGKNGSGKTTLIKLIAQQLLLRKDIHAAYMPQNYEDLLPMNQTPVEYLALDRTQTTMSRMRTYLGSMNYTSDEMLHPISQLSGGQKAKLFLLKISVDKNDVLILDEPTRNFSPLSTPVIFNLLEQYQGCIISISHDRTYLRQICTRIYQLTENGLEQLENVFKET